VRRVHPYRRLTLRLGAPASPEALAALGVRVVSVSDGIAVLEVGEESLKPLITQALERLPVVDLTVEEAPLEDVISELFARRSDPGPEEGGDGRVSPRDGDGGEDDRRDDDEALEPAAVENRSEDRA
jgi:hypothetical protein